MTHSQHTPVIFDKEGRGLWLNQFQWHFLLEGFLSTMWTVVFVFPEDLALPVVEVDTMAAASLLATLVKLALNGNKHIKTEYQLGMMLRVSQRKHKKAKILWNFYPLEYRWNFPQTWVQEWNFPPTWVNKWNFPPTWVQKWPQPGQHWCSCIRFMCMSHNTMKGILSEGRTGCILETSPQQPAICKQNREICSFSMFSFGSQHAKNSWSFHAEVSTSWELHFLKCFKARWQQKRACSLASEWVELTQTTP